MNESLYAERSTCRFDASPLSTIIDLGDLAFTGTFPDVNTTVPSGPLTLAVGKSGLVQLKHDYHPSLFYGSNYGYRSSLNSSMSSHLRSKAKGLILQYCSDHRHISALDIGSNDGTLLNSYLDLFEPERYQFDLHGVDPTICDFSKYYNSVIYKHSCFFDSDILSVLNIQFDVITSISMFYDLPDPLSFCKSIASLLKPDGVWHFEQV